MIRLTKFSLFHSERAWFSSRSIVATRFCGHSIWCPTRKFGKKRPAQATLRRVDYRFRLKTTVVQIHDLNIGLLAHFPIRNKSGSRKPRISFNSRQQENEQELLLFLTLAGQVRRAVGIRLLDPRLRSVIDSTDIFQHLLARFFHALDRRRYTLQSPDDLQRLLMVIVRNHHHRLDSTRVLRSTTTLCWCSTPGIPGKRPGDNYQRTVTCRRRTRRTPRTLQLLRRRYGSRCPISRQGYDLKLNWHLRRQTS